VSEPQPVTLPPLGARAVSGFVWSYGGFVGGRLLFFAATLVLARLLAPEDFGVVAFALAILAYANNLTSHGIGEALVYRSDAHDPRVASTAFWFMLGSSILLTAAFWVAAPALATFADEEETATWVLRALSLQLPITALGTAHGSLLRHSLHFRRLFVPEQLSGVFKGGIAVVLAVAGAGVWSLVGGQLAGALVATVALWVAYLWRPRLVLAREHSGAIARYSGGIAAAAILGEATRNLDFLIIGVRLGADELGYYALAFRLPELGVLGLFEVGWRVLFPFYARIREGSADDEGRQLLLSAYLRSVRLGTLLALPLAAATAALAEPLVTVLYGERWDSSAEPMALISIWAGLAAVGGMPGTVLKAIGRTGLLTANVAVYLALLAPTLWVAAGRGIAWVAAAHIVVQLVQIVYLSALIGPLLGTSRVGTLVQMLPGAVVAVALAGVLLAVAQVLSAPAALGVGAFLGAVVYLGLVRLALPNDFAGLASLIRSARSRPVEATS
jgi:lipopolysaccharide exporter